MYARYMAVTWPLPDRYVPPAYSRMYPRYTGGVDSESTFRPFYLMRHMLILTSLSSDFPASSAQVRLHRLRTLRQLHRLRQLRLARLLRPGLPPLHLLHTLHYICYPTRASPSSSVTSVTSGPPPLHPLHPLHLLPHQGLLLFIEIVFYLLAIAQVQSHRRHIGYVRSIAHLPSVTYVTERSHTLQVVTHAAIIQTPPAPLALASGRYTRYGSLHTFQWFKCLKLLWRLRPLAFFSSFWNILDLVNLTLFIAVMIFRIIMVETLASQVGE